MSIKSIFKKATSTITGVIKKDTPTSSTSSISSFNGKEFIQSGGTKTDAASAISSFQNQVTSVGGNIKPSVDRRTSQSRGGGGSSSSSSVDSFNPSINQQSSSIVSAPDTQRDIGRLGNEKLKGGDRFSVRVKSSFNDIVSGKPIKDAGKKFVSGDFLEIPGELVSPFSRLFPSTKGEDIGQVQLPFASKGTMIDYGGYSVTNYPTEYGLKDYTKTELVKSAATKNPDLLMPIDVRLQKDFDVVNKDLAPKYSNQAGSIQTDLQGQIDTGILTVPQAEEQYKSKLDVINVNYENEARSIFDKRKGSIIDESLGFKGKAGELGMPSFNLKENVNFGTSLAAFSNPTTASFASLGFIGQGERDIGKGILGNDLTLTQRGVLVGGGLFSTGLGIAGAGIVSKNLARSVDIERLAGLNKAKFVEIGEEVYSTKGGSLYESKLFRQYGGKGGASQKVDLYTPVFNTGDKSFSIAGGKGVSTTKFFSFEKGKEIINIDAFTFGGKGQGSLNLPSFAKSGLKVQLEGFEGSYGRGYIQKPNQDTFREFGFGGAGKEVTSPTGVKIFKGMSGRMKGIRFEGTENLFNEGTLYRQAKGKFGMEGVSFIKKSPTMDFGEESSIKFFSPSGSVRKTPFSKTFGSDMIVSLETPKNVYPSGFSSKVSSVVLPKVEQSPITLPSFQSPTQTRTSTRNDIVQSFALPSASNFRERQNTGLINANVFDSAFKTRNRSSFAQPSALGLGEAQQFKQVQLQTQLFKQGFETPFIPAPRFNYDFRFTPKFALPPIPSLDFVGGNRKRRSERGFVNTPTFYNVYAFDLGLNQLSGFFENPFKKGVKLPSVL